MNQNKFVKNADIGLFSVNMIDTFVDQGHLNNDNHNLITVKTNLMNELNTSLSVRHSSNEAYFAIESLSTNIDQRVKRSAGSIEVNREKIYLTYARLKDTIISEDLCKQLDVSDNDKESNFLMKYNSIKNVLHTKKLRIIDVELKFGCFGEVLFFGRISLRNEKISIGKYAELSDFIFRIARAVYRDIITKLCVIYIETLLKLQTNKKPMIRLLEAIHTKMYDAKYKVNYEEVRRRCLHSFTWAHYIFDEDLFNDTNTFESFNELLNNEVDLNLKDLVTSGDAKIYIGWSHSLFITKGLDVDAMNSFVHFYKIPIEIEWGEWEFLRSLNKKVEYALYKSYDMLETKKYRFMEVGKYNHSIDQFYFFSKRITESYEGLSITVNPTQLKLIKLQREKWKLDQYKLEFKEKNESLRSMVNYLGEKKKNQNSIVLNGILFLIALLSVIDISNTVYSIINTKNQSYIIATFSPVTTIFIIALLYYRIVKN